VRPGLYTSCFAKRRNVFNSRHIFTFYDVACIYENLSFFFIHAIYDYAEDLLKSFVEQISDLYGEEHVSYNVHSLKLLKDDCHVYGVLDNFSAFTFENRFQSF
jgi:hypothetical protein